MSRCVMTFEFDSTADAAEALAKLNGAGPATAQAAPRPAPMSGTGRPPAPVQAAPRPAPQRPAPTPVEPPPERTRAPKRTPQQLADAIIGSLADGVTRTANELARAIVTSPPSVIGPLAMLTKEGHIIDNGGRYSLAYEAEGGADYAEGEPEYPPGDDD